jgi:hypothetical protein
LEEKGVGWDLPLNKPELFRQVLRRCVVMNNEEYLKWSRKAQEYGFNVLHDDEAVSQNRKLFQYAVGLASNQN